MEARASRRTAVAPSTATFVTSTVLEVATLAPVLPAMERSEFHSAVCAAQIERSLLTRSAPWFTSVVSGGQRLPEALCRMLGSPATGYVWPFTLDRLCEA